MKMSLFGQPKFCLIFILSKSNDSRSETLLKMPTSSPSMEEFCRDIQKYINFLFNFPKVTQTNFKKMQVS